MARPSRVREELERRLLERPRDEQVLDDARSRQARRDRAPRADAGDAKAGRRALRQRPHGDHAAGVVGARKRRRRVALEREIACEVVLDHRRVPVGRERRAAGVRMPGLEVHEPRARRGERGGQEIRTDAAVIGRHRHEPDAGRTRRRDRAEVRRRLDQHRRAGRRERADDRRDGRLPARRDEDVVRTRAAAGLAREPRPKPVDAFDRHAIPDARPSRGARRGGGQCGERLERAVEVAARERQHARRGRGHVLAQDLGLCRLRAERNGLPAEVRRARRGDGGAVGDERALPRPRDDEPFAHELRERALHGDGARAVARDELPHGRQPIVRRRARDRRPERAQHTRGLRRR